MGREEELDTILTAYHQRSPVVGFSPAYVKAGARMRKSLIDNKVNTTGTVIDSAVANDRGDEVDVLLAVKQVVTSGPDNPLEAIHRMHVSAIHAAQERCWLTTPYFVPGDAGAAWLAAQRRRGIDVAVLTNSLAATDVAAVHAGYSRTRPALVDAGVKLYELRPDPGKQPRIGVKGSGASLHGKAALIDDDLVFVGSFNLDPRSARINCEQGALVRNVALASELRTAFERATNGGDRAWRVARDAASGELRWCLAVPGTLFATLEVDREGNLYASSEGELLSWDAAGNELFKLGAGANHLQFRDLAIDNVGSAFRIGADITDLTIEKVNGKNVRRFVEDLASGTATSAS